MELLNTETFENHDKTRMFTFWEQEDDDYLMMSWVCRTPELTEILSAGVKRVSLKDLKRIFDLCIETSDEAPSYCLVDIDETEFYIKIVSPGENKYISFSEWRHSIEVYFITKGLYLDKSDPNNWIEREYTWEEGVEHELTCRDLYRIKKMCNISD